MYYKQPISFYDYIGNNSFAYQERIDAFGKAEIVVPALVSGTLDDIQLGQHIVFAELDAKGNVQLFHGLQSLVCLEGFLPSGGNVYVVDNHNHALYCWYKDYLAGKIAQGLSVIHIDQHSDLSEPVRWLDVSRLDDLDYIAQYTNEVCTVGSFLQPVLRSGLVSEVKQVRTEGQLHEALHFTQNDILSNYVLDIDMDFWDPAMGMDWNSTSQKVRELVAGASLVTIATSPYFINQEYAIDLLKKLLA